MLVIKVWCVCVCVPSHSVWWSDSSHLALHGAAASASASIRHQRECFKPRFRVRVLTHNSSFLYSRSTSISLFSWFISLSLTLSLFYGLFLFPFLLPRSLHFFYSLFLPPPHLSPFLLSLSPPLYLLSAVFLSTYSLYFSVFNFKLLYWHDCSHAVLPKHLSTSHNFSFSTSLSVCSLFQFVPYLTYSFTLSLSFTVSLTIFLSLFCTIAPLLHNNTDYIIWQTATALCKEKLHLVSLLPSVLLSLDSIARSLD